eukprot:1571374-Amphidinium_carterae.1
MWSPRGYQRGPQPPMICFNCRGQGHIAMVTPRNQRVRVKCLSPGDMPGGGENADTGRDASSNLGG